MLQTPEIVVATWRKARVSIPKLTEAAVREAFLSFEDLWNELFPAEQSRIVQLLVERVDVSPAGAEITLKTEGLTYLFEQVRPGVRQAA